ncbi:hypothetical protein JTE90_009498 [Oedothorax gibbosus]|uniref:Uncharacterized protein n=1 Tax=Oedothorax gibbosus TaxID=931172 RepID=A0AAV6UUH8_9ARAC|nr:hypothetical protein JTE90_009498 [Oedothorax gibbosus]
MQSPNHQTSYNTFESICRSCLPDQPLHTPFVHAAFMATAPMSSCEETALRNHSSPPYDGPFKVLDRTDKTFTLDINTKRSVININRLKPAFIIAKEMDVSRSSATSSALKTPNVPSPVPGVPPRSPNMP